MIFAAPARIFKKKKTRQKSHGVFLRFFVKQKGMWRNVQPNKKPNTMDGNINIAKTRVQVLGASWIMMILMMNPSPSLLLENGSQDRFASSEPWGRAFPRRRILQTKHQKSLNFSKKTPWFWRVWFFFRTLFAGVYHFTSFPKHFASLRTPNPPHFSAPKKWQWLSKTQGGHQTVGGSHGGSDGLWICGVATGHAPQVKGLEHFFVGKMDGLH